MLNHLRLLPNYIVPFMFFFMIGIIPELDIGSKTIQIGTGFIHLIHDKFLYSIMPNALEVQLTQWLSMASWNNKSLYHFLISLNFIALVSPIIYLLNTLIIFVFNKVLMVDRNQLGKHLSH